VSTRSSRSMTRVEKRRQQDPWPATRSAPLRRRALLVVGGLAILAFVAHRPTSSQVEARQLPAPDSTACEANIEGWKFPTEVPSYMQWEPVLAALAASDDTLTRPLNVGASTLGRIKAQALSGTERARQLRAMSSSDVAVAAAIMNIRDELIRQLPPTTFDDLQAIVWKRTEATAFKLPTVGKRVTNEAMSRCRVQADFKKEPHLVPEYFVWNAYFSAKAGIAAERRLQDGSFPDSFITWMCTVLRIQPSSMISLLNIASDAAAQVEALRSQEASDRQIESAVMSRRAQLIRTLPRRDWAAIKFSVAGVGAKYFFSSTF
jgi:hypothetical protein